LLPVGFHIEGRTLFLHIHCCILRPCTPTAYTSSSIVTWPFLHYLLLCLVVFCKCLNTDLLFYISLLFTIKMNVVITPNTFDINISYKYKKTTTVVTSPCWQVLTRVHKRGSATCWHSKHVSASDKSEINEFAMLVKKDIEILHFLYNDRRGMRIKIVYQAILKLIL